jgi:hypothetical protein
LLVAVSDLREVAGQLFRKRWGPGGHGDLTAGIAPCMKSAALDLDSRLAGAATQRESERDRRN